jgi:hypothetical protein
MVCLRERGSKREMGGNLAACFSVNCELEIARDRLALGIM